MVYEKTDMSKVASKNVKTTNKRVKDAYFWIRIWMRFLAI